MRANLPKKKVLVVDNSPSVMQSIVLVLRAGGFHAAGEVTGVDALKTAQAHGPDILLCDVHLDGATGVELSLDILKLLPNCRIILMSGDTGATKILADAHARGYDFEILAKPMPPEELLTCLGKS